MSNIDNQTVSLEKAIEAKGRASDHLEACKQKLANAMLSDDETAIDAAVATVEVAEDSLADSTDDVEVARAAANAAKVAAVAAKKRKKERDAARAAGRRK